MAIGDGDMESNRKAGERVQPNELENIVVNAQARDPLVDSFLNMDVGEIIHSPYRAYMRTSPQYIPGRGISRYMPSLRNLIPIRKNTKKRNAIAVDKVGFFSFISYTWVSPFMYKAYKTGLKAEDVPQGSPLDSCDFNAQRLELLWQEEVSRKGPREASFASAVWRFVRTRILCSCLLFSLSLTMGFISPTIFMRELLQYAETKDGDTWTGVTWAICLTLVELLRIVFFAWNWALSYRTAIRLRSACLALLYRKVIRLNSLGDKSIGELINIFANDGQRIFDMVLFGPMAIGGPLVTVCGIFYIYWLLGAWAVLGMATFLLFYPAQYGVSRLTSYLRGKTVVVSDLRVKLMTEIVTCIRFIKMCAWEKNFSDDILKIRAKERSLLQKASYCQSLSISMASTVPVISAIVTFLAHVTAGNNLTAAQTFSVFTFLTKQTRMSMILIQECYQSLYEGFIAMHRYQNILIMEDIKPYISRPIDKSEAVQIIGGSFAWNIIPIQIDVKKKKDKKMSRACQQELKVIELEREKLNPRPNSDVQYVTVLHDVHFHVPKGKLIGVCGQVGAGKTSLLLACLGQLRLVSGQVTRDGSTAYVSQEAWVLNATLRDNVLFGETFDSKRYYEALYCCSLSEDVNMLPGGDQTEIGERGINLSGGQKQRVSLARALYSNRDMYFLDDPLSAVDAHVGSHIFNKCIQSALKHKTVVLVTHQVQFLNHCDEVYMLKEGRIVEHGTHEQLMSKDEEYALMVKTCLLQKQQTIHSSGECENVSDIDDVLSVRQQLERTISTSSHHGPEEIEKIDPKVGVKLMVAEQMEQGHIRAATYLSYVSDAGGLCVALLVGLCFLLNVGSTAFSSWWLATWIKAGGGNTTVMDINNETTYSQNIIDNPDLPMYRLVYAITIGVIMVTSLLRGLVFTQATLRASTSIHKRLFNKILNSPMQFFETTPVGRIQNLFSRDLDEVDIRLPMTVESILQNMWIVLFAMLFICLVFPWFIIPLAVLAIMYHFISKIFRVAIRDLKRLESVTRSPIFSCVGTTVLGLRTIHAFNKENEFISKFTQMFDENSTCLYLCCVASRWLAVRIDSLAVSSICITAFLIIALHGQVSPALAGLALAYSAHISGVFQYTIRLISETEVRFISVERMNAYIQNLTGEGGSVSKKIKLPPDWPSRGSIKFQGVNLCYREGLPNVLQGITFSIHAGEKIGIVGRTGSGKSSLIVALFRLVELASGKIKVDDVDIADITLDELRTRLSVIPQDPVLFAGTIRSNLDPLSLYSDAQVWEALEKTKLHSKVTSIGGQLQASVGQSGDNFSVGERQLLCLTRALLRNSKILVLDEATAAVDPETEASVHTTIQSEFLHCTVLTIAHRLATVTNCDRIMVMSQGQIVELDSPAKLLADHQSQFYKLYSAAQEEVRSAMSMSQQS